MEESVFSCQYACRYRRGEKIRCRLRLVCHLWNDILLKTLDQLVIFFPNSYWPPIQRWDQVRHVSFMNGYFDCHDCFAMNASNKGVRYSESQSTAGALEPSSHKKSVRELDALEPLYDEGSPVSMANPGDRLLSLPGSESTLISEEEIPSTGFGSFPISPLSIETFVNAPGSALAWTSLEVTFGSTSTQMKNLTFLSLEFGSIQRFQFPGELNLPRLRSLRLIFTDLSDREYKGEVGRWNLPSLRNLAVRGLLVHYDAQEFRAFIKQFARSLIHLSFSLDKARAWDSQPIYIPRTTWEDLTALEYLRASTRYIVGLESIPKNHPLVSIILEDLTMVSSSSGWRFRSSHVYNRKWTDWPVRSFILPHSWEEFGHIITSEHKTDYELAEKFSAVMSKIKATKIPLLDSHGIPLESEEGRYTLEAIEYSILAKRDERWARKNSTTVP